MRHVEYSIKNLDAWTATETWRCERTRLRGECSHVVNFCDVQQKRFTVMRSILENENEVCEFGHIITYLPLLE